MTSLLSVRNLSKRYETFHLQDVSFSLDQGFIMGFIGINGAGKTTTLKSMLNMVHPDAGEVSILGRDFRMHEIELKKEIGVMLGDMDFYTKKKVGVLAEVVSRFYPNWDQSVYEDYCGRFNIDQNKRICELSKGMKTKYTIAMALSHDARLLILDEPTSGLDPAARDDLLEIFQKLVEDGEKSILFSTHITSDLEKCADFITYIHEGRIVASTTKDEFLAAYRVVKGTRDQLGAELRQNLISCRVNEFGFSGLMESSDIATFQDHGLNFEAPSLEDIMIYFAKQEHHDA